MASIWLLKININEWISASSSHFQEVIYEPGSNMKLGDRKTIYFWRAVLITSDLGGAFPAPWCDRAVGSKEAEQDFRTKLGSVSLKDTI